jgi:poly(A) polymerase
MMRLLAAACPLPSLRLMAASGVLAAVLEGPTALPRLERLLVLAPEADALLRLAALLRPPPAAAGQAARVAARWRLSRADGERLVALVEGDLPPLDAEPRGRRKALYRLGAERYRDLVRLAAAEGGAEAASALAEALAAAAAWQAPVLPLSGKDVVAAGVAPGPEVGRLLGEVERWWIDADFAPDRAACLERLHERIAAAAPAAGA